MARFLRVLFLAGSFQSCFGQACCLEATCSGSACDIARCSQICANHHSMSRRPHKKSRNGCLECKRRHMRCDGNQPTCVNCGAAEIRCSFLSRELPFIVPAYSNGHPQITASSAVSSAAPSPVPTPWSEYIIINHESFDPYSVNLTHFELFNNLFSKELLCVDELEQTEVIPMTILTKHALTAPYLMHQILAMSALQLSTRSTESRSLYREYATALQTRALSLFNEGHPVLEVTPANCVHIFLFSALIGIHLLCDTLHHQRDSFGGFIDRFSLFLSVYRGLLAVIGQCKLMLREPEMEPGLKLSQLIMQRPDATSGSECDALWVLINTTDVTTSSRNAYREAVWHLQQVFDAQRVASGNRIRTPVVFAWPVLVSTDYIELLRRREAQALVILAHYAVLLHRGKNLWLMGDGGQFIIESICESLGSEWQQWLTFPKEALQHNSNA